MPNMSEDSKTVLPVEKKDVMSIDISNEPSLDDMINATESLTSEMKNLKAKKKKNKKKKNKKKKVAASELPDGNKDNQKNTELDSIMVGIEEYLQTDDPNDEGKVDVNIIKSDGNILTEKNPDHKNLTAKGDKTISADNKNDFVDNEKSGLSIINDKLSNIEDKSKNSPYVKTKILATSIDDLSNISTKDNSLSIESATGINDKEYPENSNLEDKNSRNIKDKGSAIDAEAQYPISTSNDDIGRGKDIKDLISGIATVRNKVIYDESIDGEPLDKLGKSNSSLSSTNNKDVDCLRDGKTESFHLVDKDLAIGDDTMNTPLFLKEESVHITIEPSPKTNDYNENLSDDSLKKTDTKEYLETDTGPSNENIREEACSDALDDESSIGEEKKESETVSQTKSFDSESVIAPEIISKSQLSKESDILLDEKLMNKDGPVKIVETGKLSENASGFTENTTKLGDTSTMEGILKLDEVSDTIDESTLNEMTNDEDTPTLEESMKDRVDSKDIVKLDEHIEPEIKEKVDDEKVKLDVSLDGDEVLNSLGMKTHDKKDMENPLNFGTDVSIDSDAKNEEGEEKDIHDMVEKPVDDDHDDHVKGLHVEEETEGLSFMDSIPLSTAGESMDVGNESKIQESTTAQAKSSLDELFEETEAFLKDLEVVDDSELNELLNSFDEKPKGSKKGSLKEKEKEKMKEKDNVISTSQIKEMNEQEPIFIFTSLAGGGFHMIPRTNRLTTILTANRIKFGYKDLGTDDDARKVWKTFGKGRSLPAIVRGRDDIIGNWEEVEQLNEDYALHQAIYETF